MPNKQDIFRDSKLKLWGMPVSSGDKPPSFSLQFFRTNCGAAVYTNTERDTDPAQWINAGMSYFVLGQVFEIIRAYAGIGPLAGKLPRCVVVENFTSAKNQDGQRAGKELESMTEVGIDDQDELYISLISADQSRPMIKFKFYDQYWHVFKDRETGEPLSGTQMSRLGAISTINTWEKLIPDAVYDEFCSGKFQQNNAAADAGGGSQQPQGNQGGNGGGWNGGGNKQWNNNGGNYQKKQWNNNGGGNKGNWNKGNGGGGWNGGGNRGGYNNGGGGGYNNNQGGGNGGGGWSGNKGNWNQNQSQGQQSQPQLDDNVPF